MVLTSLSGELLLLTYPSITIIVVPSQNEYMTSEGFHVQVSVDSTTGFVQGGNRWNCGTWMDKMGSYDDGIHSNRGHPATYGFIVSLNCRPRDGSAVELVALQFSTLSWLQTLHEQGHYRYDGIEVIVEKKREKWTFKEWCRKIQEAFEPSFFLKTPQDVYYKDTYHPEEIPSDSELRPNYVRMSISVVR